MLTVRVVDPDQPQSPLPSCDQLSPCCWRSMNGARWVALAAAEKASSARIMTNSFRWNFMSALLFVGSSNRFLSKKLRNACGDPAMELGWKGKKAAKRDPAP